MLQGLLTIAVIEVSQEPILCRWSYRLLDKQCQTSYRCEAKHTQKKNRILPLSYSMLSLPLLVCQQHRLVPEFTFTLHHPITILYTALVTEVSATSALHVVAAMTQLNHVPARHLYLVVIGPLYMAHPNGCRHKLHSCQG